MNTTRLYVLGILSRQGAMHGHQILRAAELDRAEFWGAVQVGSLYAALHRMEEEGSVRAVRTERAGRYPARTVYELTDAGRQELAGLREAGLEWTSVRPDPFDLALSFADDLSEDALRGVIESRLAALAGTTAELDERRAAAAPFLAPVDEAVMDHIRERLTAEQRWHASLLGRLDGLVGAAGRQSAAQRAERPAGQAPGADADGGGRPSEPPRRTDG
jgi:DNA-binding PadR family transcriptional regulator